MAPPVDRRLARLVPAVRFTVAGSVLLGFVSTASVVVQALALGSLLSGAMLRARPVNETVDLAWLAGALAVRGFTALGGEILAKLGASWAKADLRSRLVPAALRRAPGGAATPGGEIVPGHGDVATVAGRGIDALDVYVGRCLPDFILAATAPIALAVAIGVLDWVSCIVIVVVLGLFPVFGGLVGRTSAALAKDRWSEVEALGRHIVDVFEGLPVLKAFGRSTEQRKRIESASEALRQASLGTLRVAFLSAFVLDELASVAVAVVAVPLGLRLLSGSIHLSAALAVLVVAPEVFVPLRRASADFHQSTEGLAAASSVIEMISGSSETRPPAPTSRAATKHTARVGAARRDLDPAKVPIRLDSVSLHMPSRNAAVLEHVSLAIAPGETVVLTGPSGAGKSTIVSLLLGFLAPSSGSISVGGVDLSDLDMAAWRRQIAYLPEHPTLIAGTLAENLRLACGSASDAQLVETLAAVGGHSLLADLDEGLRTPLGEGGRPTSAGERQRIALARVLLRPASLYLLDEPTVHLDVYSEAAVVDVLAKTLRGKSALLITHRQAPLALGDAVFALVGGRIESVAGSSSPVASADWPSPRFEVAEVTV